MLSLKTFDFEKLVSSHCSKIGEIICGGHLIEKSIQVGERHHEIEVPH